MDREEEIRRIAYQLWMEAGQPLGRDLDFWLKAEAMWEERARRAATMAGTGAEKAGVTQRRGTRRLQ